MKLIVYVMYKTELLDKFLVALKDKEIHGATILNSTGMASRLAEANHSEFIGSLKSLIGEPRKESHVILIAIEAERVPIVYETINEVCGSLKEPHTGIAFTIPIEEVRGSIL